MTGSTAEATPAEARLMVDLDALAANYAALQREAPGAEIAPVVKADGYGLGAAPIARRLWAEGARRLFVARLSEGVALRAALGPARPATIYVLDGCVEGAAPILLAYDLRPVLNSVAQWDGWFAAAGERPAALHVDTGLNRLGVTPEEAEQLAIQPQARAVEMVASHLASADDPAAPMNEEQQRRFHRAALAFPQSRTSLAASAGIRLGAAFRGQVVRPGIALFGAGWAGRADQDIRTVVTLEAPILQVRDVGPEETVGYGAHFRAREPMQVAVAAVGYADGVLRAAGRARYAWCRGGRRALLGRISMDLTALDVTGCAAAPGDWVEMFGPNLSLDEAAEDTGTIAYELLTGISPRVRRLYRGAGG